MKGTKAPHGTITRYTSHGCRCDDCRAAIAAYFRRLRGSITRAERLASIAPDHGTESMYTRHGCRCDACREASRAARAGRRAAAAARAS